MKQEEYIWIVKEQNGHCNCKDLAWLFSSNEKVKDLEMNCNSILNSLAKSADEEMISIYHRMAQEFMKQKNEYFDMLFSLIKEDKLKFVYHSLLNGNEKYKLDKKEALDLREKIPHEIITIDCSNCNQQVRVFSGLN